MTPKALERSKEALVRLLALSDEEWGTLKLHCPNAIKDLRAALSADAPPRLAGVPADVARLARQNSAQWSDEIRADVMDDISRAILADRASVRLVLEAARDALATSYNVLTYPGDGKTKQDKAIALIDATLPAEGCDSVAAASFSLKAKEERNG